MRRKESNVLLLKAKDSSKIIEKHSKKHYSNDNIEINENIELEYEIKIPKFLYDYVNSEMNKNYSLIHPNHNCLDEFDNQDHSRSNSRSVIAPLPRG